MEENKKLINKLKILLNAPKETHALIRMSALFFAKKAFDFIKKLAQLEDFKDTIFDPNVLKVYEFLEKNQNK